MTFFLPSEDAFVSLFYGSTGKEIYLETSYENVNYYDNYEVKWYCVPIDPDKCQYCPSDDNIKGVVSYSSGSYLNYTIEFEEDFENDCTYEMAVEIIFSPTNLTISTTRETLVLSETEGGLGGVPLVRFDSVSSSCSAEESDGQVYLAVAPVEGLPSEYSVLDYVWEQTEGPATTCDDNSTINCGGDGNPFLFFTTAVIQSCVDYSWDVTVVIGIDEPVVSIKLPLCEMSFLSPPKDGSCFVVTDDDSDDCVKSLSTARIRCEGWVVECFGVSEELTSQLFRVSDSETGAVIPLDNPNTALQNEFFVSTRDMEVQAQVCNAAVCTTTDPIPVTICEESEKEREEAIENTLEDVQQSLEEDNLESALQSLLAVGDSLDKCEDYFDAVIRLTDEYIITSFISVEFNASHLGDTSVLMELLGVIGSQSCAAPKELFESLSMLCSAPTSADIQTFALDELLQAMIDNLKSDDEKIEALDFAITVNECIQGTTLPARCNDRLPTLFEGDSFYFAQYIFTMQQFQEGNVRIDIPNATVFFPKNFDQQIARDYTIATGDPVIRFSCVAINMVRTDTILSTGVSIDSAVVGMTAMVYVNDTALTIELGHQGSPVLDIILRIYRQIERSNEERSVGEEKKRGEGYSKRLTLGDGCDESVSCSYYEGEGLLSPSGCETLEVTDEYVDCACDHYSNFGLLFSTCDQEEWTIYRILSLSLFAAIWLILIVLGSLVLWSSRFREMTGLETMAEKRERAFGAMSHD